MNRKRRRSDRAGRPVMGSPGRPPVARREDRQRFWAAIARGASSEDAAVEAGVSAAVGVRWFREGGGMPSVTMAPLSGRYLSFTEREEIALLRARGCGVRGIARQVGRSPSTGPRASRASGRPARLPYPPANARRGASPPSPAGDRTAPADPALLLPCGDRYPSPFTSLLLGVSARLARSAAWVLRRNAPRLDLPPGPLTGVGYARVGAGGLANCPASQSSSITRVKRR
jgi:hypothetical protein